jgi:gliding motility associated protien GldN
MKKLLIFASLIFAASFSNAQPLDGIYEKVVTVEKEIIPYDHIREADVFWAKRIWRIIDVREKMNLIFSYPQMQLGRILHEAAASGDLTVYDNTVLNSDQFKQVLELEKVNSIGSSSDTVWQINPITLQEEQVIVANELTYDKIIKYRLKEDWFFDEETSTFQVRIVGVAPVMEAYDSQGNYIGDETMYWIYYPDIRELLARHEAFNPGNDAVRLSWEDIFEGRFFASYIYKESNVYDRSIQEYATGLDALFESDRIKQKLFEFEHDLWSY